MKYCPNCGQPLLPEETSISDNKQSCKNCNLEFKIKNLRVFLPKRMVNGLFVCTIALICLTFVSGILLGALIEGNSMDDIQIINESYHIMYTNFIHDQGAQQIENIVRATAPSGKNPDRLDKIADLITKNFTDPNWQYQMNNDTFCYYPNYSTPYTYCLIGVKENLTTLEGQLKYNVSLVSDKLGHIRQGFGSDLSTDPYWIAYQKTGECQELSYLFKKVANDAGFETRIVSSNGISHYWNEVNLSGEWKFFDLQRYGEVKGEGDSAQWFGNRSNYSKSTGFSLKNLTIEGVCVHNDDSTLSDVTLSYDPNNLTTPIKRC